MRRSSAPEFQINAREHRDPIKTGALYNVQPATEDASLPTGQWNSARLVTQGGKCEHWVNDRLVCRYDLNSNEWKQLWKASKHGNNPRFAQTARGWIGLQSWDGEVFYRNIRIRSLDSPAASAAPQSKGTPAAATKDEPFVNTLGMKFVPVPITGGPTGGQRVLFSIWETRVQDHAVFADEEKRGFPDVPFKQDSTHPVVRMTWESAQEFCAWLTAHERAAGKLSAGERYRLPSDHEWSCAAGIGHREDPAKTPEEKNGKIVDIYPWGDQWPPPEGVGNFAGTELTPADIARLEPLGIMHRIDEYRDGFTETSPVGSFAANALGLHDLSGNVEEWCEDWWNAEQRFRVARGGTWTSFLKKDLSSADRHKEETSACTPWTGFRVVLAPVP